MAHNMHYPRWSQCMPFELIELRQKPFSIMLLVSLIT